MYPIVLYSVCMEQSIKMWNFSSEWNLTLWNLNTVADPGFPVGGGVRLVGVATFRKICMSKRKNWDPWGLGGGCAPLDSPLKYIYFFLLLSLSTIRSTGLTFPFSYAPYGSGYCASSLTGKAKSARCLTISSVGTDCRNSRMSFESVDVQPRNKISGVFLFRISLCN